jgi:hypothetical protein
MKGKRAKLLEATIDELMTYRLIVDQFAADVLKSKTKQRTAENKARRRPPKTNT